VFEGDREQEVKQNKTETETIGTKGTEKMRNNRTSEECLIEQPF
jgi:hypothetical protein